MLRGKPLYRVPVGTSKREHRQQDEDEHQPEAQAENSGIWMQAVHSSFTAYHVPQ